MPEGQVEKYAKEYNLSKSTVERYFRECRERVDNQDDNYDKVVGCVKSRCKKKSDSKAKEAAKNHEAST